MQTPETASKGPGIAPPIVHRVLGSGGGKPLDPALRHGFEARLGHDLAGVRLYTGGEAAESARAVNARAYSVGQDIVFGSGAYAPGTDRGQRLLAHELTHTIQQSGSRTVGLSRELAVGAMDDVSEREAEAVANAISPLTHPASGSHQPAPAPGRSMVRRAWYDRFVAVGEAAWGGAKWVGGKVASGAEATWEGAQWVGGKAVDVGEAALEGAWWLGGKALNEAERVIGATWACAKATGSAIWRPISLDLFRRMASKPSISGLLGVPEPKGASAPGILDTIISIVQHPCLRMIPGYSLLAGIVAKLPTIRAFLSTAWEVMQNPSIVLDALQAALGGLIAEIPGKARALTRAAITFSEPRPGHLEGIWRHLEPKLDFLVGNWWEIIKQTGEDLLWPWEGVSKNLGEIWDHLKAAGSAVWDLDFSGAIDHLSALWRKANEALGRLYGWFVLAAVLIGAIGGAILAGPAGVVAGVGAALNLAMLVGKGLLISTIAAETASIAKAGYDLRFTKQTPEEQEEDYEQIANSGLTLAITGAMFALGALAARFARAVISRVSRRVWQRLPKGKAGYGHVMELRVALAAIVEAGLLGILLKRVKWLERLKLPKVPGWPKRRKKDWPGADLQEGGQVIRTPRGQRRGRTLEPGHELRGGRLIQVKSSKQVGADIESAIRGWVDDLAAFTGPTKNVTATNTLGRTLVVALETPLSQPTMAALSAYAGAAQRRVTIQFVSHLPPNHPFLVIPQSVPVLVGEVGVVAASEVTEEATPGVTPELTEEAILEAIEEATPEATDEAILEALEAAEEVTEEATVP